MNVVARCVAPSVLGERGRGEGTVAADNVSVRLNRWRECFADFDRNSWVNGDDADAFWAAYYEGDPIADVDGDEVVTPADFDLFMSRFIEGC